MTIPNPPKRTACQKGSLKLPQVTKRLSKSNSIVSNCVLIGLIPLLTVAISFDEFEE